MGLFVSGMCLKMTEIFSSKMAELFSLKTLEIVVTGVVTLRSEVVFLYQLQLTAHTKSISCLIAFEIKTISVSRGFFRIFY